MNRVPGGHQLDNISENATSTNWFIVEGQRRLMCECKGTVRQQQCKRCTQHSRYLNVSSFGYVHFASGNFRFFHVCHNKTNF